jgi:hypothetical protein
VIYFRGRCQRKSADDTKAAIWRAIDGEFGVNQASPVLHHTQTNALRDLCWRAFKWDAVIEYLQNTMRGIICTQGDADFLRTPMTNGIVSSLLSDAEKMARCAAILNLEGSV